jgi:Xaa-Pro aminopeptidase
MPSAVIGAATRLERVRALLDVHDLDGVLLSRSANKRWLAGFVLQRGEEATSGYAGTLLVTRDRQLLLADGRYIEQAAADAPDWELVRTSGAIDHELGSLWPTLGVRRCGAEAEVISHGRWQAIAAAAPTIELVALDPALAELRLIKDHAEQEAVARACTLTDACFAHVLATVRAGFTERRIAWEIEDWFRANGAESLAFDSLVLVGARASMPHGHPSDAQVEVGKALLIDFGCQVDGYRSDMTRTVFIGEPDDEARRLYRLVADAQAAAFALCAPGVSGTVVDAAAREMIFAAGFGEAFSHGLGHGIGLETHEAPSLRLYPGPLQVGMTFTLEPGIYLPDRIGIRIEDDILLTEAGPRYLTTSPRDLTVI